MISDLSNKLFLSLNHLKKPPKLTAKEAHQIIKGSGLFRLDFYAPSLLGNLEEDEAIALYIHSWSRPGAKRKPMPGFHPGVYLEQAQKHKYRGDPFAHFIQSGCPSGPWTMEVISPDSTPSLSTFSIRAGIHFHVYYLDLVKPFIDRLNVNRIHPDLYISVTTSHHRDKVALLTEGYQGKIIDIQVVPNRGRDIGALLTAVGNMMIAQYDIIGHFHTKKTPWITPEAFGQTWFDFLLENLIGGHAAMSDIILTTMATHPNIGLVFADDPGVYGWTKNYNHAKKLARKLGLGSINVKHFNFAAGNMFWVRSKVLKPLLELGLTWRDYPPEPIRNDGSLLHAIERLITFIVRDLGFCTALTNIDRITR